MSDATPPPPPPPPPSSGGSDGPPAATTKPWWKRWWGIALIVLGVLLVIGIATGGGEDVAVEDTGQDGSVPVDDAVTPDPTEDAATAEPAETAEEPEAGSGFGNGTYTVGEDVEPGTYRSDSSSMCYWARLSGFSGELDDVIANGNQGPTIVTIAEADAGFETQGCGQWIPVEETFPAAPETSFGDGSYVVGSHIEPGTYRADGSADDLCYWARLGDFSHELSAIVSNGNSPTVIEIAASDAGFEAFGCGTWTRTG